jgi:hypothetical protein
VKSYRESDSFYPAGYTTTLGRPMPAKRLYLAERACVTTDGKWYVKTKAGTWDYITAIKVVANAIVQSWVGGPLKITPGDIDKFIDGDPPIVRGAMAVPTSTAPCIEFQGGRFINTWRDTFLPACPGALTNPALREALTLLMRVIREGLCGRPNELTLDEMLTAATSNGDEELQFRFVMSWLAAPLQSPGINLQTNCWLLGSVGGVGKGLLTSRILPRLYGAHNVAVLDAAEIEQGGWTDVIEGKLVVVVNELDARGKWGSFWNTLIKRSSADATVPIRKRGTHGHEALNFANWIITSNNDNPQYLDAHDRRNALIGTTADKTKGDLASSLYHWMHEHEGAELDQMLGGLMHILLTHKVDRGLIDRAPDTRLKEDVLEAGSDGGEGLYWLENSSRYTRDKDLPASDYLEDYIRLTPSAAQTDVRTFGGILSDLARHGHIQKTQKHKTHRALYLISSEKFPPPSDGPRGTKSKSKPPFELVPGGKE